MRIRSPTAPAPMPTRSSTWRRPSARDWSRTWPAQAERFQEILPQYQRQPALFVQQRLTETLGRVLTNVQDKIFVAEGADGKPRELRLLFNRELRLKTNTVAEKLSLEHMQVTSLLSRHEHEHDESCATCCGHDHEHAPVRLWQTLVGVVFVLNAFLVDWLFEQGHTVASASALDRRRHPGLSRLSGRPSRTSAPAC